VTKQLRLGAAEGGGDVSLSLDALVTSKMLVQANSGGGKSWLLRLVAEQAAPHLPVIFLDSEGEFASLRERFDFVLVGEGGEIRAEKRSAALLARKLVELEVSAVVDLYDLRLDDRREFVSLFLDSLINLPRSLWHPTLVVLDEAQKFCPEKGAGSAASTQAVIDLMSLGRKRGYCGVLATQRFTKLHNDAIAEANNVLIGRTWLLDDQERAGRMLGIRGDERRALRELGAGEFLAFGPALSPSGVVRFRSAAVQTTHPKSGQRLAYTPPKASEAVRRIAAQFEDLPREAEEEARSLETLRAQLDDARRTIARLEKSKPPAEPKVERVEVPILDKDHCARLELALKHADEVAEKIDAMAAGFVEDIQEAAAVVRDALERAERGQSPANTPPAVGQPAGRDAPKTLPRPRAEPDKDQDTTRGAGGGEVSGVGQKILDTLAQFEAMGVGRVPKVQAAFLAGYSNLRSKSFANAMGSLHSAGYITYPSSDSLAFTQAGRSLAAPVDAPLTTRQMQGRISDLLGSVHRGIVDHVIAAHPRAVEKTALAEKCGYNNVRSKSFANALGRLHTLGFVGYPEPGHVVATPLLFPDRLR
jgi:uncharacterized protein